VRNIIDATRAELAKPKPEPVGWFLPNDYHGWQQVAEEFNGMEGSTPLYLHLEGEEWWHANKTTGTRCTPMLSIKALHLCYFAPGCLLTGISGARSREITYRTG
jgi:hypothetical protein